MRENRPSPLVKQASSSKADYQFFDGGPENQKSERLLLVVTSCAVALPLVCAYQQPPLPAFFNQALATGLWSVVLLLLTTSSAHALRAGNIRVTAATLSSPVALWSLLLAVLFGHVLAGLTPAFIAGPIAVNLALAIALSATLSRRPRHELTLQRWLRAMLVGILIAALFNSAVVLVQMAAPNFADDTWIARTVPPHDRAGGNVRQPNQLATLMVWGLLATGYFWRQHPLRWLAVSVPLLAALVATGSRTGMVSLVLILIVALSRSQRVRSWRVKGWLALATAALPLAWFAESIFTRSTANVAMSLRLALWRDVLELVTLHPWFGVGWGQLNFAWTLTPLPARAADVFDHAHNLPLHLAAELGLPVALLVVTALSVMLWRARSALRTRDGATVGLLLAAILLHSLFEYPLWFSYFLLPSAALLAWLVAAGSPVANLENQVDLKAPFVCFGLNSALALVAVMSFLSVIYAAREYRKQVSIHRKVGDPGALDRAVATAQASRLYGHFGDYAAIMLAGDAAKPELFTRPIRHVLDERLLNAYARALARAGDDDRAAFVTARAREFAPNAAFANLPSQPASSPAAATLLVRDFRR